jgi:FlgD Ig-like domain/Putative serine esterase (DUF676)
MVSLRSLLLRALWAGALLSLATSAASSDAITSAIDRGLGALDRMPLETGVLYDRVLPLSGIERFDGSALAPAANLALFRQMCDELRRASRGELALPDPATFSDAARHATREGVIPIAVLDARYERLRPEVLARLARGEEPGSGALTRISRAFVAAALVPRTFRGREVMFAVDASRLFGNATSPGARLELDPGDGSGLRGIGLGERVTARYASTGMKTLHLRLTRADGSVGEAAFTIAVEALSTPTPNDTLHVTASETYLGQAASGSAYVDLAPGHAVLTNPVILVEGFDLDNTMGWDELYALLNRENLLETLRSRGYDAVVLDLADATDYIQRNGLLVAELIRQIDAAVAPSQSLAVVGASMGGLCSRYALDHLEQLGQWPRVRTFISFDTPHLGADIPLGIQYWTKFFSTQSADAAYLLGRLQTPAARQMLVYHLTDPPTATGASDPLRAQFLADLAAAGDWPIACRKVAITNGSGAGVGQGFAAGQQIVRWDYSNIIVTILGNVWAVPAGSSQTIFDGRIRILFGGDTRQTLPVGSTLPYDNAPGGWRNSMAQMDSVAAPYGDIIALFPNHCFIPTVSAIALGGTDLFHNLATDPAVLAQTPFDVIHLAATNQAHVMVTPQNAQWFLDEIPLGPTVSVPPSPTAAALALSVFPHPFRGAAEITFRIPVLGRARVTIHDILGRTLRTLFSGDSGAEGQQLHWDGRDAAGRAVPAGLYFVRLETAGGSITRRLARVE